MLKILIQKAMFSRNGDLLDYEIGGVKMAD